MDGNGSAGGGVGARSAGQEHKMTMRYMGSIDDGRYRARLESLTPKSLLYLKHQFKRSSHAIFLQITPYNYFKLICCTPIDGQTTARHGPDARGPRHVMPAWPVSLSAHLIKFA
jgi:hypothetical protein